MRIHSSILLGVMLLVGLFSLQCGQGADHAVEPTETPVVDPQAQKRTVADIRNMGTAMFTWLTDQASLRGADQAQSGHTGTTVNLAQYVRISSADLEKALVPRYMQEVPKNDGWGHPYEFYLNTANPLATQAMAIRSPGRDGKFDGPDYTVESFSPGQYDEDLVWADGFFVRWPQVQRR